MASDGSPLPSARAVSVTVHRPVYRDDPKFTVMLAVWGQFMDHDVTATALSLGTYAINNSLTLLKNTYNYPTRDSESINVKVEKRTTVF